MQLLNLLRKIERSVLVALFLIMVLLYTGSVVTREIGGTFASRFAWIEEAVRMMNLFLVFLALGLALERGKHVGITNLRQKLPEPLRRRLLQVIDTVGLLFSLYVAWLAFGLVQFVLKTGQVSPTLGVPIGLIYMAPVVGFVLLALRYGLSLFGVIDRFTPQEATQ
ncbi:C4-dicarboxylate ABC transporter permease (plasmid) [Pacificitalea manganoxidans]|uniref:TRAP transporter small permease protein n=1 Tax=Pacificitalea manganoxidans TaxID=1411902 RepID=A0A291M4A8_9RHOB|nr:TRAP transporter small permease [Pacificitalea manganoxidans]ATI43648.1 C4-dicarboxylate ABC transporter permease [Pacificitalea manganoxidans]MBF51829.1 TRAP transporter small permease [Actibacterium sp.]MDR6309910.1 TRAP-type C4-dicarboxylate transport system permease small subunit [Pacificitalea manganoxidans]OWU67945.1 C4-dicarboxylate ABC transporter permease [Roseovarius sp. 22II1-1F6A]|tara:strand:+ start:411 stop:908 length:498 start_codon:yes stop_codon:yes gene_type:complete